jgi:hypothetical protein
MPAQNSQNMPQFGLVCEFNGEAVAAGFLRAVEGNYAMFDSYVTNPEQEDLIRHNALDRITQKLIKIAKHNKVDKLLMFSADYNTLMRAVSHGFSIFPHAFASRDLVDNSSR